LQCRIRDSALVHSAGRRLKTSGRLLALLSLSLLTALSSSCLNRWEAQIETADGATYVVNASVLRDLEEYDEEESGTPFERLLWNADHAVVQQLLVTTADSRLLQYDWPSHAQGARWQRNGSMTIGTEEFSARDLDGAVLHAEPPPMLSEVVANLADIPVTAAHALGWRPPSEASGRVLDSTRTEHVMLLFLDGFGYVRYQEALHDGLIPHLAALGEPLVALTAYPPSTRVASAVLLTGARPHVSGVTTRSDRSTEIETLFDVAAEAGVEVVAVEGEALSFNLRNATVQLSGDRDGNGSTDDNVLANTLPVLQRGMPRLFFVHFHGIDDAGHEYGPGAPEEEEVIRAEDDAVRQILDALPDSTMLIIFADHGMHWVNEEGRVGNHGNLIERDMFVPILVHVK